MNSLNFSYFPVSPVRASATLVPLSSWYEVVLEAPRTGIEFDDFWLDSICEGVAYLFSWHGATRATVLTVWSGGELKHVECRTFGDGQVSKGDAFLIEAELERLFALAGFRVLRSCH